MQIHFGHSKFPDDRTKKPIEITWRSRSAVNGVVAIAGGSGAGKTHTIRSFVAQAQQSSQRARFIVPDVHGDITLPGMSSVVFSESTNYGLNPLRIVDDKDWGGVRRRIREFTRLLNSTSRKLGPKQEACLTNIMEDMYRQCGFYRDDARTWSLDFDPRNNARQPKRQPTLSTLKWFCDFKLKQMTIGTNAVAVQKLNQLEKIHQRLEREHLKGMKGDLVDLKPLQEECIKLFAEYINSIETGRELDDVLRYSSKEVMKSVQERISNLAESGIFRDEEPPFDPRSSVWRYDISTRDGDEKVMFVHTLLEDLFFRCRRRGLTDEIDTFFVLDEAHLFMSEEDSNPINLVAREARKFGLGMILASQSFDDYPDPILTNAGCTVVLSVHEKFHKSMAAKLGIEQKRLTYIQPRRSGLIQVRTSDGSMPQRFVDVMLPQAA